MAREPRPEVGDRRVHSNFVLLDRLQWCQRWKQPEWTNDIWPKSLNKRRRVQFQHSSQLFFNSLVVVFAECIIQRRSRRLSRCDSLLFGPTCPSLRCCNHDGWMPDLLSQRQGGSTRDLRTFAGTFPRTLLHRWPKLSLQ